MRLASQEQQDAPPCQRGASPEPLHEAVEDFQQEIDMDEQAEIPGIQPMRCKVPHDRAHRILIDTGAHSALAKTQSELESMQKQHPGVAGLTLAIAIVARHSAERQMASSRAVLIQAANAGMPIERHAIALVFDDDGLFLEATSGKFEGE